SATKVKDSPVGDSSATRNTIAETFFGGASAPFNNDGLSWPPLPRFWGQEGYSDYREFKFSIGTGGTPIQYVSAERAWSSKYEVTTIFHYLGSLKMLDKKPTGTIDPTIQVPLQRIDESTTGNGVVISDGNFLPLEFNAIFEKDYKTYELYFKPTKEYPIIGMCQYEISLYYGVSNKLAVTFVLGAIAEGGRVDFSRMAVYSKMFNLKSKGPSGEYSPRWYLNNECDNRFKKYVKPFIDDQFAFKVMQYNAYLNPYNTCSLENPVQNKNDISCDDWHNSFWSRSKKRATVGRCAPQPNGRNSCILKSRVGQKCSMYYTDGLDSLQYNLKYLQMGKEPPARPVSSEDQGPFSLATLGEGEYPCDDGLICSMDSAITATCKKIKSSRAQ
ncbi:hypothetical protein K2X05_12000, partial [bacterium]|nr:hypothetical protein [bacterium]